MELFFKTLTTIAILGTFVGIAIGLYDFDANNLLNGYKMIGNAVSVNLAFAIAQKIKEYLC